MFNCFAIENKQSALVEMPSPLVRQRATALISKDERLIEQFCLSTVTTSQWNRHRHLFDAGSSTTVIDIQGNQQCLSDISIIRMSWLAIKAPIRIQRELN